MNKTQMLLLLEEYIDDEFEWKWFGTLSSRSQRRCEMPGRFFCNGGMSSKNMKERIR